MILIWVNRTNKFSNTKKTGVKNVIFKCATLFFINILINQDSRKNEKNTFYYFLSKHLVQILDIFYV